METKKLHRDEKILDADWHGNNAAFTCPVCNKVFLVSAILNEPGGERGVRLCPNCKTSTGRINAEGASIEW